MLTIVSKLFSVLFMCCRAFRKHTTTSWFDKNREKYNNNKL